MPTHSGWINKKYVQGDEVYSFTKDKAHDYNSITLSQYTIDFVEIIYYLSGQPQK